MQGIEQIVEKCALQGMTCCQWAKLGHIKQSREIMEKPIEPSC